MSRGQLWEPTSTMTLNSIKQSKLCLCYKQFSQWQVACSSTEDSFAYDCVGRDKQIEKGGWHHPLTATMLLSLPTASWVWSPNGFTCFSCSAMAPATLPVPQLLLVRVGSREQAEEAGNCFRPAALQYHELCFLFTLYWFFLHLLPFLPYPFHLTFLL